MGEFSLFGDRSRKVFKEHRPDLLEKEKEKEKEQQKTKKRRKKKASSSKPSKKYSYRNRVAGRKIGRPIKDDSLAAPVDRLGVLSSKLQAKHLNKPKHLDLKISLSEDSPGSIVFQFTFFTEEGLRIGFIYDGEGSNKYTTKVYDKDFNVTECNQYETIEAARSGLSSYISDMGELENSGLVKCIRDILIKINQTSEENFFLFKLLTDPEMRRSYEISHVVAGSDVLKQQEIYTPKSKVKSKPYTPKTYTPKTEDEMRVIKETGITLIEDSFLSEKTVSNHNQEEIKEKSRNIRDKIRGYSISKKKKTK